MTLRGRVAWWVRTCATEPGGRVQFHTPLPLTGCATGKQHGAPSKKAMAHCDHDTELNCAGLSPNPWSLRPACKSHVSGSHTPVSVPLSVFETRGSPDQFSTVIYFSARNGVMVKVTGRWRRPWDYTCSERTVRGPLRSCPSPFKYS